MSDYCGSGYVILKKFQSVQVIFWHILGKLFSPVNIFAPVTREFQVGGFVATTSGPCRAFLAKLTAQVLAWWQPEDLHSSAASPCLSDGPHKRNVSESAPDSPLPYFRWKLSCFFLMSANSTTACHLWLFPFFLYAHTWYTGRSLWFYLQRIFKYAYFIFLYHHLVPTSIFCLQTREALEQVSLFIYLFIFAVLSFNFLQR